MITHYDLFAGIGGFSLALEEVFDEPIRHVFCEWEVFPTSVLKRHWPDGEFWGDIADLVAHTRSAGLEEEGACEPSKGRGRSGKLTAHTKCERPSQRQTEETTRHTKFSNRNWRDQTQDWSIVTGGFPCQPFSHAGRRKGTADDRYQWPNMFAVIRNTKPEWVIAENVRGLVTWSEGLVLEQVCSDLERQGYEVQPLIIPAVAVNAPHRRDRVWIIANNDQRRPQEPRAEQQAERYRQDGEAPANTRPQRRQEGSGESLRPESQESERPNHQYPDWQRHWQEVAFECCVHHLDDGVSRELGGTPITYAKWRKEGLKAMGNAIVPEVAMQIFKGIKEAQYANN